MATHRLWLPVGVSGVDFPQVPLFSISPRIAGFVDAFAAILGGVGLVGAVWRHDNRPPRWCFAILAISLGILFATNQHRLQPWAYQGWIYSLIFALASPLAARRFLIALAVSVYAYSALGKFDAQFIHTVGPDFVSALPSVLRGNDAGGDDASWRGVVRWAVLAMPVIELGIAFFLALPKTRRIAGMAAIAMHGTLLGILGPWGLGHSGGVLVWNVFLAIQAWLLFVRPIAGVKGGAIASDAGLPRGRPGPRIAANFVVGSVVVMAIVMPLFERSPRNETYGFWDHWLSWSLYSPHTSRVAIQVHGSQIDSLPPAARPFAKRSDADDGWFDLRIDRWSLAELAVPVYPQARFQVGVAYEMARGLESPSAIRIKIRGVSDRRTGVRQETWAIGLSEIQRQVRRHWFLPDR